MRKLLLAMLGLLLMGAGLTYWHLHGRAYELRLTEEELRSRLQEHMPYKRSALVIFEITLDHPRLRLFEQGNRIATGIDLSLNILVGDERKPLGGSVDVETGLRYDASKGNFHLTAPKIDRLEVQGIPLTYRSQANAAVAKALEEFFARYPVYTLHNTDLKQLTTRLVLRDVNVTGGDLVLTLGI